MTKIKNMLYTIYAESTPNPEVMKFVANRMLVDKSIEITNMADARGIDIAEELLKFPFVKSLYMSSNFISISKDKNIEWEEIAMHLRVFINDFLNDNGIKNYTENISVGIKEKNTSDVEIKKEFNSQEKEIDAIITEYIKPAVESDGGNITLKSLEGNIVTVNLKGACSGCPSAASTLKGGIESLLKEKFDPNIIVVAAEI